MITAKEIILNKARGSQEKRDQHHLQAHNNMADECKINEYTMVKCETTDNVASSKLHPWHPKVRGPLRVIANISSNIYACQNLITTKNEDFHVKFLVPFY